MFTALIAASVFSQAPSAPPLVDSDGLVQGSKPADAPEDLSGHFVPKTTFGIGSFQGGNAFSNGNGSGSLGLLGAYVRVGWQQTEHWGAEIEGAATTIAWTSTLRGAFWVTFTANDWLTLGLGGALGDNEESIPNLFGGGSATNSRGTYGAAVARIDFHAITSRNESGGRRAFTFGLQAEAGANLDGPGGGEGLYLTMGFVYW